ncbi:hypothetical protein [Flavivirga rizhaonensis]|uniref:DUF4179 domain-containing protein n=1 Tax=Flavivirga rizhaonensis TaxID=2559571 RepID=A0A4S1DSV3_9FLAO|nr:hypothetical protein [Flavivirga rizhaonensis]TGV00825.1 hypothetical protein EM932_18035 [Flavivirga rizhaonensis]
MARDIRELFKDDKITHEKMPENHQERFLEKLDEAMPVASKSKFNWMRIAASIVLLIGLGFGAFKFLQPKEVKPIEVVATETDETKTLGDVSPGLKKVEDYYLASINLELSKMKYTPETKDLFDGYLLQLDELDKEYKRLSEELTESGPSELTVNALIDNLKFRLNLLYRLRDQLKELNTSSDVTEEVEQSI